MGHFAPFGTTVHSPPREPSQHPGRHAPARSRLIPRDEYTRGRDRFARPAGPHDGRAVQLLACRARRVPNAATSTAAVYPTKPRATMRTAQCRWRLSMTSGVESASIPTPPRGSKAAAAGERPLLVGSSTVRSDLCEGERGPSPSSTKRPADRYGHRGRRCTQPPASRRFSAGDDPFQIEAVVLFPRIGIAGNQAPPSSLISGVSSCSGPPA